MSFNRSLLTLITRDLEKKKKASKPKSVNQQKIGDDNPYYIDKSDIAGKGAFAKQFIPKGSPIDLLHQINQPGVDYDFTQLGKSYNHSEDPNTFNKLVGNQRYMVANQDIYPGQELTGDYRMQPDLEQPQEDWKMKNGGQTRNEREMVNGIADILSQVRDPRNRAEIAKKMRSDFREQNVTYDPKKFMQMARLQAGGVPYTHLQLGGQPTRFPIDPFGSATIRTDATRVDPRPTALSQEQIEQNKIIAKRNAIVTAQERAKELARRKNARDNSPKTVLDIVNPNGGRFATEEKFRLFPNDTNYGEFFDEWLNPLYFIGHGASGLGNAIADRDPKAFAKEAGLALAAGALGFDPLTSVKNIPNRVAQSMESGLLSNAYKINPWAFKPNPEAAYRGIGKAGAQDALSSGVFRQAGLESGVPRYDKVYYGSGNKGFATAKDYSKDFIAELPTEAFDKNLLQSNWSSSNLVTKQHIPINQGRILQKDWLRGYKPIEVPNIPKEKSIDWGKDFWEKLHAKENELKGLGLDMTDHYEKLSEYEKSLLGDLGVGKNIGGGSYGQVYESAIDPSTVIKLGRPMTYGNLNAKNWTSEFIESANSVNKYGNIAVPKNVKYFEVPSAWNGNYEYMEMPNLNRSIGPRLDLNKRDRYALFLKQARQLRDKGIKLDVANPQNFSYNADKNIFDIYDINPGTIDRPGHYMQHIINKTKGPLLDNMLYKNGGWLDAYQEGGETLYNDVDSTDKAFLASMDKYKAINPADVNAVRNNMVNYINSPLYSQRQANFPENYLGDKGAYQKKKFEDTIARQKVQQRISNIQKTPYHIAGTNQVDGNQFNHRTNSVELNPYFDLQGIGHEFGHVANNSMMTNFNGIKNYRPESDYVNGRYWDSITDKTKRPAFSTGLNQREVSQFVDLARPLAPNAMFGNRDPHEDKTTDPAMFADESYGDLMGVRQLLHQKGYTKNFGDNIDQQLIDKAMQDKDISNDFIFKRMYNKYGSDNMIKLNNTIAYNNARPGMPMAQDGGEKYTVQPGQYLSQIAKANNVSVEDLVMANKISNPNLIKPGQELLIPEGANNFSMPSKDGYYGFDQLMERQKKLSSLPAADMIKEYRKQSRIAGNYAVVDKASGNMNIYNQAGEQVSSFPVGTGKDYGDKRTINVQGPNRRNTTPAGIYTLTNKGSGRDSYAPHYGNNIWELVDHNNTQQPVALHQVPNELPYRNAIIGDKNTTNNRITNGCINCRKRDFDTEVERYMTKGSQIYVLPDDPNNKFVVKNNKIMLTGDKFDKDVSYSKRDLTAKPIQIKYAKSQFGNAAPTVQKMAQSLVNNKQALMKDLNIDNDTFNELSKLTLGVAGQESNYGDHWRYQLKEGVNVGNANYGQAAMKVGKIYKNFAGNILDLKNPFTNVSPNSRGYTQIKYNSQNKDVRNLFAKYGIKNGNDLTDPSKSNIAALIMMGYMHNNELPQLKKQMDKLGISKTDAILYLNQGKRGEIVKGTATPSQNNYINSVKDYAKRFVINQKLKDGGDAPQGNWLENYN